MHSRRVFDMEHLPVEVIAKILSRLGCARNMIKASATCRKWHEAFCEGLNTLSFSFYSDPGFYHNVPTSRLEMFITQTIFQTSGLQDLSFGCSTMKHVFSASAAVAWLMHTRKTLLRLVYNLKTHPEINFLDICGRRKLEELALAYNSISRVEPNFHRFPCLRSLSLSFVNISANNLGLLLMACPKIEGLELISLKMAQKVVELNSPTVKIFFFEGTDLDKFILAADSIQKLNLKDCIIGRFDLIGKRSLKYFKTANVSVKHIHLGDVVDSLESLDVKDFTVDWPKFYQMVSSSSKLKRLRLWDILDESLNWILSDFKALAACFPQLNHLSLTYHVDYGELLKRGDSQFNLENTSKLKNVVVLELRWDVLRYEFFKWVQYMLIICPNVRKLIIDGVGSETNNFVERLMLAKYTSSMAELLRKYMHIEVQFEYH